MEYKMQGCGLKGVPELMPDTRKILSEKYYA